MNRRYRQPRQRPGLKWLIAAKAALAAVAAFLLSVCDVLYYGLTYARDGWYIGLYSGDFICGHDLTCPEGLVNSGGEPYYWGPARGSRHLCIPLWPFEVAFLPLVFAAAWLFWKDTRYQIPGLCHTCGYDLTGLPDGACPECGSEP